MPRAADRCRRGPAGRFAALLLALSAAAVAPAAGAVELSEQERAGKRIFEQGVSPSGGTLAARIGMAAFPVSGQAIACGNCHGEDGLGRPEGGVKPPNIRWSELSKPYERQHPTGRRTGPFDERTLRRALFAGIDPAGNELDRTMPRYEMSDSDLAALTAYLKKLEFNNDPGIADGRLRIGTLLPLDGRLGEPGRAIRGVLEAYFDAVNAAGGIHGRQLELVVAPLPDDAAAAAEAARRLVGGSDAFAVLAPVSARIERELTSAAEAARMPVVGPVTLFPEDGKASSHYVFHLLAGVPELAQVLGAHAAAVPGSLLQKLALLHVDSEGGRALADAAEARLRERGYGALLRVPYRPPVAPEAIARLAGALQAEGVQRVLLLGPGFDLSALARAAAAAGFAPHWLIPGPLAPRDVLDWPPAARGKLLLAYPTLPQDQKPAALAPYAELFQKRPLIRAHQPLQVAAYSSALLLVEGLKRAGRDLSRRKLIAALETVQDFDLGMVPPVSYNASRRVGALGGYVVGVDLDAKTYRPLGDFIRLPQ